MLTAYEVRRAGQEFDFTHPARDRGQALDKISSFFLPLAHKQRILGLKADRPGLGTMVPGTHIREKPRQMGQLFYRPIVIGASFLS